MIKKTTGSRQRIEDAVRAILVELGVPQDTEVYANTPRRAADLYMELSAGMAGEGEPRLALFDNHGYRDIVVVRKIPFYSVCPHHLLPMFGDASIAYVPGEKVAGLSKFPRVVKHLASRLQLQEEFTTRLVDYLHERMNPVGVMAVVRARHMCVEMRGARASNVETVSTAVRGIFETDAAVRDRAQRLLES